MTLQALRVTASFALASASLAGCGGGGSQMPSAATLPPPVSQASPMDGQQCQTSDGIKVIPCRVRFDAQHPGTKDVLVTTDDRERNVIRERDNCAARNVATVTQMSNHHYVVAGGSVKGTCTASFTRGMQRNDDNRQGSTLTVDNEL